MDIFWPILLAIIIGVPIQYYTFVCKSQHGLNIIHSGWFLSMLLINIVLIFTWTVLIYYYYTGNPENQSEYVVWLYVASIMYSIAVIIYIIAFIGEKGYVNNK